MSELFAALGCATLVKLLLALSPGLYHSTDLEVHRNWLAVTHSLPLSRWYWDATSRWTLDYPPLFAYFQWLLAQVAAALAPSAVVLSADAIATRDVILFQRLSVVAVDCVAAVVLIWWAYGEAAALRRPPSTVAAAAIVLVSLNAGLVLVDHVHFQYNGGLLAILVAVAALLARGRPAAAVAAFTALVCAKHLFMAAAPAVALHALRCEAWWPAAVDALRRGSLARFPLRAAAASLGRLAAVALLVAAVIVCPVLLAPSTPGLPTATPAEAAAQLLRRLFPFGRGLTHAYWAANAWAVYQARGWG